jgi:hypothetical protein
VTDFPVKKVTWLLTYDGTRKVVEENGVYNFVIKNTPTGQIQVDSTAPAEGAKVTISVNDPTGNNPLLQLSNNKNGPFDQDSIDVGIAAGENTSEVFYFRFVVNQPPPPVQKNTNFALEASHLGFKLADDANIHCFDDHGT